MLTFGNNYKLSSYRHDNTSINVTIYPNVILNYMMMVVNIINIITLLAKWLNAKILLLQLVGVWILHVFVVIKGVL